VVEESAKIGISRLWGKSFDVPRLLALTLTLAFALAFA
jgi:hypothetical protein